MYQRDVELEGMLYEEMEKHEDISHLKDLRIAALTCDRAKKSGGKIIYADCSKISSKMEVLCDADFVITFYLPNISSISPKALGILCWHELKHIGWDGTSKSIIPHDLEDFRDIVKAYGTDWIDEQ